MRSFTSTSPAPRNTNAGCNWTQVHKSQRQTTDQKTAMIQRPEPNVPDLFEGINGCYGEMRRKASPCIHMPPSKCSLSLQSTPHTYVYDCLCDDNGDWFIPAKRTNTIEGIPGQRCCSLCGHEGECRPAPIKHTSESAN